MALEDPSVFLDTDEFAVSALLAGKPVVGILEGGFFDGNVSGYGPAGSSPTFLLPQASVDARPEGQLLVITSGPCAGTNYKVGSPHPDGTGWVTLHLLTT